MTIPWWAQAACAGILSAAPTAATNHHWSVIAWSFAAGTAAYIVGKVQAPPSKENEK